MNNCNLASTIINQTFELIGVLTLDGRLLEVNQSALDYLGIQLEQVRGQPFWQAPWWTHSPQQQQQLCNAIDQAKTGKLVRCEVTHRSTCGLIEPFDFSVKLLRNETGESSFLICEGRNINLYKQAEQRLQVAYAELEDRMAESVTELRQSDTRLQQAQIERQESIEKEIAASVEVEAVKTQIVYLLERITDGFLAVDRDWRFVYINPQGAQLLQRSPSELIGKSIWEEFPNRVNSLSYQEFHRAMTEQISLGFEAFCLSLDAWFEFHLYPSVNGLSIYFRNITARKQSEATLRASEERYRSVVAALQEGIIVQSAEFVILACNESAAQILGLSQNQMLGKSTLNSNWRTIHEDGSPFPHELYPSFMTLRTGQPCSNIVMGIYKLDGTLIWILMNSQPLFAVGEPLPYAVVTSFTDISDRLRIEGEHKKAEQKIREQAALLDVASDAIYVCDLSSQIEFWNQGAERLYGWQREEALGNNVGELLSRSQTSEVSGVLDTLYKAGEWRDEVRKVTKSGKDVTVISRLTLVRDSDNSPRSILTVDTDITEKKQLEAQFLRAQRLESIGTLASGIAHDLNNILTPVLSIAQLLPRRFPNTDESTQHLLEILEANARRGGDLVKQVLSFARGCNGQRTPMQAGHLLAEVAKIAQQTFPKSIEIRTEISTRGLRLVHADATQLHQVIMNLCVNARDAMCDGGTLTITAENCTIDETFVQMHADAQIGSYIKLTITDTGTGIAPDVLDRIFDSFFTTKEQGKGTGLGLPTVMTIIKNHGGFLNVATQVECGTTFAIYLPAIEQVEVDSIGESTTLDGSGELILVVDDELPIRQTLKTTLESHHYRAIVAQDGIDALALYAQHKDDIQVVLLDLMMPTSDGFRLMVALLKINPQLPLIAMSGSLSSIETAPIKDSVRSLLAKPFTTQTLLQTLQQVLAKKS